MSAGLGLRLLAAGWPQSMTTEQAAVYAEMLSDVPPDELLAAVKTLVRTCEFRPSVAVIRRAVIEGRGEIPAADVAAEQYEALDEWERRGAVPLGAGRPRPPRPAVHETVARAFEAVGAGAPLGVFQAEWRRTSRAFLDRRAAGSLAPPPALDGSAVKALGA